MAIVLKILFGPMQPLIGHPERAYVIAAAFAILAAVAIFADGGFRPRIHVFGLGTVLLWVLFGLHEHQARQQGWNIRVDLLLFWPVLLVMSLGSVRRTVRSLLKRKPADGDANQPTAGKPSPK